jgi:glycosyltransferase involved in cell wall biosynthesis
VSALGRPTVNVVFVSSHSQMGGSEKVLEELLESLPESTIGGVVALQDGPLVERLRARPFPVTVIATGASVTAMSRSAVRLARHLRRVRPQVVHANGVKAALVSAAAARLAAPWRPVPVLWMKHCVTLDGPLGRLLAERCAVVAGVSREVLTGLDDAGRQVLVHPGVRVDTARAAEDAGAFRRRLGVTGPVITVIGRLDPAKGHAELLETLPDVLDRVPDATALLVGPDDSPHPGTRERLARRIRELGVEGQVRLLPHEPSATVIAASDVVCIPTVPRPDGSGREGFGLVAAEALTLGVPVVGYDVGATGEVLDGCGVLLTVGDREGLAREVTRLLSDPGRRAEMVTCGRRRARDLTLERTAHRLLDLYEEVAR